MIWQAVPPVLHWLVFSGQAVAHCRFVDRYVLLWIFFKASAADPWSNRSCSRSVRMGIAGLACAPRVPSATTAERWTSGSLSRSIWISGSTKCAELSCGPLRANAAVTNRVRNAAALRCNRASYSCRNCAFFSRSNFSWDVAANCVPQPLQATKTTALSKQASLFIVPSSYGSSRKTCNVGQVANLSKTRLSANLPERARCTLTGTGHNIQITTGGRRCQISAAAALHQDNRLGELRERPRAVGYVYRDHMPAGRDRIRHPQ